MPPDAPPTVWQNGSAALLFSGPAGFVALPHEGTPVVALALSMRYTVPGAGWSSSSMRAGRLSDRSALWLPTSTTAPILSAAPVTLRASSAENAAARLSGAAATTAISPVYGAVPLFVVKFVPAPNVTVAVSVEIVKFSGGNMPAGTRMAAPPVPFTDVAVPLGSTTRTGYAVVPTMMSAERASDPGVPGSGSARLAALPPTPATIPRVWRAPVPA